VERSQILAEVKLNGAKWAGGELLVNSEDVSVMGEASSPAIPELDSLSLALVVDGLEPVVSYLLQP